MTSPTSAVAGLFVEHSDLSALSQTVDLNAFRTAGTNQTQAQSFWATPQRTADDPTQEALEIALASPRLINWVHLEVSRFPHTLALEYIDTQGNWVPLRDAYTGAPVIHTVLQSVPPQLPRATAVPGHRHPQHSFAGHWERLEVAIRPVPVSQMRVVLQRTTAARSPVDAFGLATGYSLAVRDLTLGYQVASRADIPRTLPQSGSPGYQQPFAATNDLLGSSIDFALRDSSAARMLGNTDTDADVVWRCEPQPFPQAVVNFYADLRNDKNEPTLVDQIFLDPLTTGAHVTLYYSNDTPVGGFTGSTAPVPTSMVGVSGPVTLNPQGLDFGTYGSTASLLVHDEALGYDPSLPWWVGITFTTAFAQGVDSLDHPLLDCGLWRLVLTATGASLIVSTGDRVDVPFVYQGGQVTSIVAAYTGDRLLLHVVNSSDEAEYDILTSVAIPSGPPPDLCLGSNLGQSLFFNGGISSLVLKEEVWTSDDYLTEPYVYSTVAQFSGDDVPQTLNALLRLDPSNTLISPDYPWALYASPAAKFEQMTWTPIPRDFTAQRGWMYLPTTRARFWKVEFTNLQAEYHDVYVPTPQLVKTFPPSVLADYASQLASAPAPGQLGYDTQASMVGFTPYADFPQFTSTGGTGTGYTNTEVYVAEDYHTGQRLYESRGENWAYHGWHSGLSAPRFSSTSVHSYTEQTVTRTAKLAYGVGLRQLVFARSNQATQQDAGQYEDMFFDATNLVSSTWTYDVDRQALTSAQTTATTQATSAIFKSIRNVRAVQFAAAQSQAIQLLPDEDFADPQLQNWLVVGDARVTSGVINSPLLGTVVSLTRDAVVGYWADIAPLHPTWGDFAPAGTTYAGLTAKAQHGQTFGGMSSNPVAQPLGGRVYAAARVIADKDLTSPLWVQVIDSVTGDVLSEQSATVKAQQVTEWYTGYTVGEGGLALVQTWGDLAGTGTSQVWQSYSDTFARANANSLGQMNTGQFWTTPSGGSSLHLVSSHAQVTALGQISQIDTGTPWGVLTVGLGTSVLTGTPSASVPLLNLGGFVLMNDGRLIGENTGQVFNTVTLASGDTLVFNFLPTATLPSGQTPAGVDATITPWALTVSRNGTYQFTICTTRSFLTQRALRGQNGQIFTSFAWAPGTARVPVGKVINKLPMPTDGAISTDGTYWTQADGTVWSISQSVSFSTAALWQGSANSVAGTPAGVSPFAGLSVDVGALYGTFSFAVGQLAPTVATTNYYLAILDYTPSTQLYLRADGALVQAVAGVVTVLKANAVPSVTSGTISVKFTQTASLSAAFKATYGISNTTTQTLVFLVSDVVVGTYSATGLWAHSVRGLLTYNDGAGNYSIMTGAAWSTDANGVTSGGALWSDVDQHDTITWGDLSQDALLNLDQIAVRVIQKNASVDSWSLDTVSLFADPIVWEFSNDGGNTFIPAHEIRNDPRGVLVFPPLPPDALGASANQLCYRVTAFAPNAWISHLVARPWYQGFMQGVPVRPAGSLQGPNVNPHDHYPPIEQDPRFQVWHLPIPREWYFAFRNRSETTTWITPVINEGIVL